MKANNFNYLKQVKSEKGFTITELLIAIVIIGILAGISAPSAFKWVEKEKQNSYITHSSVTAWPGQCKKLSGGCLGLSTYRSRSARSTLLQITSARLRGNSMRPLPMLSLFRYGAGYTAIMQLRPQELSRLLVRNGSICYSPALC